MQREYDMLNEEIGLENQYLRNNFNNEEIDEHNIDAETEAETRGALSEDFLNIDENDFDLDSSMTYDNIENESVKSDDNNNSITEDLSSKKFK